MNNNTNFRIRDLQEEDRPQNRLLDKGPEALSNSELLSLIIKTGTRNTNAFALTQKLLSEYDLQQLSVTKPSQLMVFKGIKKCKAAQISACFELARRLQNFSIEEKRKISSPEDIYRYLYPSMQGTKKEQFIALYLDTKNQILKSEVISVGSLNANVVHPREVFKSALINSAAHIIVSHNHPSGDPTPSREDIEITKTLVETGKIIGIQLLDHVIIGDNRHFSMKEAGHI